MSPENAHIFYIEDHLPLMMGRIQYLTEAGHTVEETASSLVEALDKISRLPKSINVAIVDGNLSQDSCDGVDGKEIAQAIKNISPDIIVIGVSDEDVNPAADIHCPKSDGVEKLIEVVTQA